MILDTKPEQIDSNKAKSWDIQILYLQQTFNVTPATALLHSWDYWLRSRSLKGSTERLCAYFSQ